MATRTPPAPRSSSNSLEKLQTQIDWHMPSLSKPVRVALCLWSLSIAVTQRAGLTTVAAFVAGMLGCKSDASRQRLREFSKDADAKKGDKRLAFDVGECFLPMLKWVLSALRLDNNRLMIALDASTLANRFTVLAVSVVYRGVAVPVGWTIVSATAKGAWKPLWLQLLGRFRGAVPEGMEVFALTDRGLYAKWLFEAIQDLNWHPFMRINKGGKYTKASCQNWTPLDALVKQGQVWRGKVRCFKGNPLACTLLARWDHVHTDPWLILTDIEPETVDANLYAERAWIEACFKDIKRGGYQWQNTRMEDPERAARLWLAIAVAMLMQIQAGIDAEDLQAGEPSPDLPPTHISRILSKGQGQQRKLLSLFRIGGIVLLVRFAFGKFRLPAGRVLADGFL